MLRGSAVCTNQEWVPCPTCTEDNFKDVPYRFQNITGFDESGQIMNFQPFALRNNCDGATFSVGMVNLATTVFVMIGAILMIIYLRRM